MNINNQNFKNVEKISKIILYPDLSTSNLNVSEIRDYLQSQMHHVEIITREDFVNFCLKFHSQQTNAISASNGQRDIYSRTELANRIAFAKVRDIYDPRKEIKPLKGELAIEDRLLADPTKSVSGILYDGIRLHQIFQELLPGIEVSRGICHIIFTPRLFATFDKYDRRYHARVSICGYPSLISTAGIVEAPAKPKEYYKIKESLVHQGITTIDEFVPSDLKEKYLKYNDERLTEVLKGYVWQAIFYQLISEPFCPKPTCRLYNSHWQEEVVNAQLSKPEFCEEHSNILEKLRS
jgi:hypothetical protein